MPKKILVFSLSRLLLWWNVLYSMSMWMYPVYKLVRNIFFHCCEPQDIYLHSSYWCHVKSNEREWMARAAICVSHWQLPGHVVSAVAMFSTLVLNSLWGEIIQLSFSPLDQREESKLCQLGDSQRAGKAKLYQTKTKLLFKDLREEPANVMWEEKKSDRGDNL